MTRVEYVTHADCRPLCRTCYDYRHTGWLRGVPPNPRWPGGVQYPTPRSPRGLRNRPRGFPAGPRGGPVSPAPLQASSRKGSFTGWKGPIWQWKGLIGRIGLDWRLKESCQKFWGKVVLREWSSLRLVLGLCGICFQFHCVWWIHALDICWRHIRLI